MEHLTENQKYIAILKEELVPAMGCTEPIAVAYAAAVAAGAASVRLPHHVTQGEIAAIFCHKKAPFRIGF